jgi:hypothetical protein
MCPPISLHHLSSQISSIPCLTVLGIRIRIMLGSWIRIRIKVESWVRIRIKSEKQDPDPHQSEKVEALDGHFEALEGPNLEESEWQDPDPHQS